jgi:hypothetical protein
MVETNFVPLKINQQVRYKVDGQIFDQVLYHIIIQVQFEIRDMIWGSSYRVLAPLLHNMDDELKW